MSSTTSTEQGTSMTEPHDAKPENPDTPPLRAFERSTFNEQAIATRIGRTVTRIKEEDYQNKPGRNEKDVETDRTAQRRIVAAKIFEEFGMLEKSAEVAFSTLYTATERKIESEELPKAQLVGKVLDFEKHPVIRTAISLAMVVGERHAKEDAIAIQRTAALLLDSIEPANVWGEDDQ